MNTLDLIVLAIIGISGLFAFARGFVREALSIGAWVASGFVAIYGFPTVRPIARSLIGNPTVADIVAGAALFLGALVILTLATAALASRVKGSALSALDRTLGFVFGLIRGAVLACLAWVLLAWAWPEAEWPDWAQKARLKPFLESGTVFETGHRIVRAGLCTGNRGQVTDEDGCDRQAQSAPGSIGTHACSP